jgi:hypothetical protein
MAGYFLACTALKSDLFHSFLEISNACAHPDCAFTSIALDRSVSGMADSHAMGAGG